MLLQVIVVATNIIEEESSPPEISLEQTGDSNESQHAFDILRKNYYDISQSIKHPVVVAHLLVTEKLVASNIFDIAMEPLDNSEYCCYFDLNNLTFIIQILYIILSSLSLFLILSK